MASYTGPPKGELLPGPFWFGFFSLAIPIAELVIAVHDRGVDECLELATNLGVSPYAWLLTLGIVGLVTAAFYMAWGIANVYVDIRDYERTLFTLFVAFNGFRLASVPVSGVVIWRDSAPECWDESRMFQVMLADFFVNAVLVGSFFLYRWRESYNARY